MSEGGERPLLPQLLHKARLFEAFKGVEDRVGLAVGELRHLRRAQGAFGGEHLQVKLFFLAEGRRRNRRHPAVGVGRGRAVGGAADRRVRRRRPIGLGRPVGLRGVSVTGRRVRIRGGGGNRRYGLCTAVCKPGGQDPDRYKNRGVYEARIRIGRFG